MRKLGLLLIFVASLLLISLGIHNLSTASQIFFKAGNENPPSVVSKNEVKVLTIAMFEIGAPKGDNPGEAQLWIEGEKLDDVLDIPGSYSPIYCNTLREHCLVITGIGTANATATLMAVGQSDQIDLTKAYILVAGIAGTPPDQGTLGAAAWAEWVVDGDVAREIDAREIPKNWLYPYFRFGCDKPWCDGMTVGTEVYHLNSTLTEWAYQLSKNVELADNKKAQAYRLNFPEEMASRRKPFVTKCDSFAASTYWHGKILSNWAKWWTKQFTKGKGNYCMTNMEDSGTLTALTRLAAMKRVDINRVMVLRTASNFDQPYFGQTTQQSVGASSGGFMPSIQNAYRVGSVVAHHIIKNWQQWQNATPALRG